MSIFKRLTAMVMLIVFVCNYATVSALPVEQKRVIGSGAFYFDIATSSCGPGSSSGGDKLGSGDLVYILGDSITVGTEPRYKDLFAARGINTFINGSGGRAWTWGGSTSTPQGSLDSGKKAVERDQDAIKNSDGIVIALGSNGGLGANPPDEVLSTIKSYNSTARIWWVNTIYSSEWEGANGSLGDFNADLQPRNGSSITVIDWFRAVDPTGDPTKTPGNDPDKVLLDGLHPSTPATYGQDASATGQERLANLVVNAVAGGTTSGGSTTGTGGSYSATIWGSTKTLQPEWIPILGKAGQRFGVDPAVLAALLSIETGWDSPESFATNPRRNSASATGPFQFIDLTSQSYMPEADQWYSGSGNFTSAIIKQLNDGSDREPDGSYVVDGNKDGKVDRATPEDAALMAAAYMKSLGISTDTPLGEQGDYRVPRFADANPMTVRLAGAYYNQGAGWSAPNATTAEELNSRAQGNNDVAHYMDQMWEVTKAGRESGVYGGSYGGGCGTSKPATGDASQYIKDCGVNDGNAEIACIAINELQGIPYSQANRPKASDTNPATLDCSGLVNMAIYRAFNNELGLCSAQYQTDENFQQIDVHDIQPGDIVGKGTICGENSEGVVGHVAIVVSYDAATQKLITVEASSEKYPSGLRGIGGANGYNVGLKADGNGSFEWAVRYVGPKG